MPQAALREKFLHHVPMHVGEPEVAALEAEGQFGVIEAKQMQQRRVQVVDVYLVHGGVETEFVGFADGLTHLHAAASELASLGLLLDV